MNVCQVCGGSIHPLAGRCKHCKADLSKQRDAEARARRAAAATPVPTTTPASSPQPAKAPTPRASSQPAPMPGGYHHQPAVGWRRRWPIAVAAVALVAISFSAGMLIERSRGGDKTKSDSDVENSADTPDATNPKLGGPGGKKNSSQPQASLPTTAPAAEKFQGVVIATVCSRLHSCGMLNAFSKQMCEEMAAKASDPKAASKIQSGKCSYNKSAASACLASIKQLKCDMKSSNVMDWVDSAGKLVDCTSAYRCN